MSDANSRSLKQPVTVEREVLLAVLQQNAALHLKVGNMHLREARLIKMVADLLNTVEVFATSSREMTHEASLRTNIAAQVVRSVVRDLKEMMS